MIRFFITHEEADPFPEQSLSVLLAKMAVLLVVIFGTVVGVMNAFGGA